MSILERRWRPELMDLPEAPADELHRSLGDLRSVNRWLGGTRTFLRLLAPLVRKVRERPIRLLDVATGSGDIPVALSRWARSEGERLEITAADLHEAALEAAREHTAGYGNIQVTRADALRLPFADGSFHIVTCCTALHHFDEQHAVLVLRELRRVASDAVLVLDLRRSAAALVGVRLLAATAWRTHPMTRHDGPASVRGAFTASEMRRLAHAAGYRAPVVREHSLIRISLIESSGGIRS